MNVDTLHAGADYLAAAAQVHKAAGGYDIPQQLVDDGLVPLLVAHLQQHASTDKHNEDWASKAPTTGVLQSSVRGAASQLEASSWELSADKRRLPQPDAPAPTASNRNLPQRLYAAIASWAAQSASCTPSKPTVNGVVRSPSMPVALSPAVLRVRADSAGSAAEPLTLPSAAINALRRERLQPALALVGSAPLSTAMLHATLPVGGNHRQYQHRHASFYATGSGPNRLLPEAARVAARIQRRRHSISIAAGYQTQYDTGSNVGGGGAPASLQLRRMNSAPAQQQLPLPVWGSRPVTADAHMLKCLSSSSADQVWQYRPSLIRCSSSGVSTPCAAAATATSAGTSSSSASDAVPCAPSAFSSFSPYSCTTPSPGHGLSSSGSGSGSGSGGGAAAGPLVHAHLDRVRRMSEDARSVPTDDPHLDRASLHSCASSTAGSSVGPAYSILHSSSCSARSPPSISRRSSFRGATLAATPTATSSSGNNNNNNNSSGGGRGIRSASFSFSSSLINHPSPVHALMQSTPAVLGPRAGSSSGTFSPTFFSSALGSSAASTSGTTTASATSSASVSPATSRSASPYIHVLHPTATAAMDAGGAGIAPAAAAPAAALPPPPLSATTVSPSMLLSRMRSSIGGAGTPPHAVLSRRRSGSAGGALAAAGGSVSVSLSGCSTPVASSPLRKLNTQVQSSSMTVTAAAAPGVMVSTSAASGSSDAGSGGAADAASLMEALLAALPAPVAVAGSDPRGEGKEEEDQEPAAHTSQAMRGAPPRAYSPASVVPAVPSCVTLRTLSDRSDGKSGSSVDVSAATSAAASGCPSPIPTASLPASTSHMPLVSPTSLARAVSAPVAVPKAATPAAAAALPLPRPTVADALSWVSAMQRRHGVLAALMAPQAVAALQRLGTGTAAPLAESALEAWLKAPLAESALEAWLNAAAAAAAATPTPTEAPFSLPTL